MDARLLLLLALSPAAGARQTAATLPGLDHYAWGFPVAAATAEPASFYRVQLPLLVNQSATDAELRDLGVYNADGQAVPRVLTSSPDAVLEQERRFALPAAALRRDQMPDAERIRLMFVQMSGETRIGLSSDARAGDEDGAPLSAYILDARAVEGTLDALEFVWPEDLGGFIGRMSIAGSDDLEDWEFLGAGAVADLREEAAAIEQRRVGIAATDADFLRLSWTDLPADFRLDSVNGLRTTSTSTPVRETLTLTSNGIADDDGGYLFDLGGMARIDQVGLRLPEVNTVVTVAIEAWLPSQERWVVVHEGTFHHIRREETTVVSNPASIRPLRAARWKAVIRSGNPDTSLQLQLGWRPDTLLFVAQGAPPFTLAVGRDAARAEQFPQERLLGGVPLRALADDNGSAAAAKLGARFPLAGEERELPRAPADWRAILLWSALSLAVLFVVAMAVRLMRGLPRGRP